MKKFLIIFILLTWDVDTSSQNDDKQSNIIETNSGKIQGKIVINNCNYHYEFLGIPYAEPPVGKLRFKPPTPVLPWSDVFQAFEDGPMCLQRPSHWFPNATMSEDCLTLNIFTNEINEDEPKPVMIWIHGGGFAAGRKDGYKMQPVLDEDVILVAVNYRLHALGFLSFGNNLVSGNMGLKDQHLAIQWVRQNIRYFGGDPERITLFGQSAGGISVQAHVISPFNQGLQFSGIAQSGSILYLSVETPGIEKKFAKNAAEALDCPVTLDQDTLDCLQNIDATALVVNITDPDDAMFVNSFNDVKFSYWPNIDDYADEPFLPMDPLKALMEGSFNKVPYITGTTKNEGSYVNRAYGVAGAEGADAVEYIKYPATIGFNLHYGQEQIFNDVALKFYNHTYGDSPYELEKPAIDFSTDINFLSYDQKSSELMSHHIDSVYNYYFTQKTNRSRSNLGIDYTPQHGDDEVFLVSDDPLDDMVGVSEEEMMTMRKMIKYWTNFAKTGNPNSEISNFTKWLPVNKDEMNYLELKAQPAMKKNVNHERMYFLNQMIWREKETQVFKSNGVGDLFGKCIYLIVLSSLCLIL